MKYNFSNCNSLAECAAREAKYLNEEIATATDLFKLRQKKLEINHASMTRQSQIMEDMLKSWRI